MSSDDDAPMSSIESEIVETWNALPGLTRVVAMNAGRRKAIKARMKDRVFREHWREAMDRVAASDFCRGQNKQNWIANLDWFLRPGTVAKAIEGQYGGRQRNGTTSETIEDYLATYGGQP